MKPRVMASGNSLRCRPRRSSTTSRISRSVSLMPLDLLLGRDGEDAREEARRGGQGDHPAVRHAGGGEEGVNQAQDVGRTLGGEDERARRAGQDDLGGEFVAQAALELDLAVTGHRKREPERAELEVSLGRKPLLELRGEAE